MSIAMRSSYIVADDLDFLLDLQLQCTGYILLSNPPLLADIQPNKNFVLTFPTIDSLWNSFNTSFSLEESTTNRLHEVLPLVLSQSRYKHPFIKSRLSHSAQYAFERGNSADISFLLGRLSSSLTLIIFANIGSLFYVSDQLLRKPDINDGLLLLGFHAMLTLQITRSM